MRNIQDPWDSFISIKIYYSFLDEMLLLCICSDIEKCIVSISSVVDLDLLKVNLMVMKLILLCHT
jgi:hypothetical protein